MEKDTGSGSKSACRSWDGWLDARRSRAVAYGAEMEGGLSVAQDAAWTRFTEISGGDSVKADGLASLTWENENQEYESGDENLFSSGNQDGSLENDQYDFSDETIPHPTSYELVVWLSEYFQPDASFMAPEGCLKEELLSRLLTEDPAV